MNKNIIARIRLNAGQIGYFDDLTQLYLSHQNPTADVLAGMNCTTLVSAVKAGKISVIEGSITQNSRVKKLFKMPQITVSANEKNQPVQKAEEKTKITEKNIEESAAKHEDDTQDAIINEAKIAQQPTETKDVVLKEKGESYSIVGFENATFTSSDTSVASVTKKGGKVTAKGNGTAVITVSRAGQEDAAININVSIPDDAPDTTKDDKEAQ